MNKTQAKQYAQDYIMQGTSNAMHALNTENAYGKFTVKEFNMIQDAIIEQVERVEKLFGYSVGSWQQN